jgi:hypothetical protein
MKLIPLNRLVTLTCVAIVITSVLSGCSAQQLYDTGQAWQQNQCNQTMVNEHEREGCLNKTNMPYEDYKQQTEDKK